MPVRNSGTPLSNIRFGSSSIPNTPTSLTNSSSRKQNHQIDTPYEIIVGQLGIFSNGSRITSMEMIPTHGLTEEAVSYNTKAVVSMDGLFRPVSISGDGALPQLIKPTTSGADLDDINSYTLNPYQSGHDIDMVAHGSDLWRDESITIGGNNYPSLQSFISLRGPGIGSYKLYISGNYLGLYTKNTSASTIQSAINGLGLSGTVASGGISPNHYYTITWGSGITQLPVITGDASLYTGRVNLYWDKPDYRTLALRGPILLQSWGYDTDGYPVPNAVDTAGSMLSGVYASTDLSDEFYTGYLKHSETWPVAPIDIRLDRERGVWTATGGTNESSFVVVVLLDDLLAGSTAAAAKCKYVEHQGWIPITVDGYPSEIITVSDMLEQFGAISKGNKVICSQVGTKYWVTNSSCTNSQGVW